MSKPRVVLSIEARMGSSRLPGKVLANIHGKPALLRLIDRLKQCQTLDNIVVATSTSKTDDVLADWCQQKDILCFRGSEEDVLSRIVDAHKMAKTDIVVEITGDCPLTDPEVIDLGVETFLAHDVDVVSNCGQHLTWPMGQYVQVFSLKNLDDVARTVTDPAIREHVSLYFYEHPEKYKIIELIAPKSWQEPNWRWQLDYPEDLEFLNQVCAKLDPIHGECFSTADIVRLLRKEPDLVNINIHCEEKSTR